MSLFTVNTEKERNRREREVRWCQRWDFADSIFTHQTELFPVSTWPNSRSQHLTLSLSICLVLSLFFSPSGHLSGLFSFIVVNIQRICLPCLSLFTISSFLRNIFFYSVSLSVFCSRANFHLMTPPPKKKDIHQSTHPTFQPELIIELCTQTEGAGLTLGVMLL